MLFLLLLKGTNLSIEVFREIGPNLSIEVFREVRNKIKKIFIKKWLSSMQFYEKI